MFTTLATSRANKFTHPDRNYRYSEIARMMVHAMGFDAALLQAEHQHLPKVAQMIQLLRDRTISRY